MKQDSRNPESDSQSHSQGAIHAAPALAAAKPIASKRSEKCKCCRIFSVLRRTRKLLVITGDERIFELPTGFSERLHGLLSEVLPSLSGNNDSFS